MKRDMDLIRRIVLELRDAPGPISNIPEIPRDDYLTHAALILEAKLAHGSEQISGSRIHIPTNVVLFRLTWAGHDFADSIKDDTLWKKAKEHVLKPSASWTCGVDCSIREGRCAVAIIAEAHLKRP